MFIVDSPTHARTNIALEHESGAREVFGGIVILSCYSGERIRKTTLVEDLATQLKGLVATGTTVAGADGYSFGTKEFQSTGRSSVLSRKLASFYFLADTAGMQNEWLAHRPTHPDGILKTQFSINVDTQKTIGEQLQGMLASRGAPRANKAAQDEALGCVTSFTKKADAIQKELERVIALIPGDTVAARADYFANNTGNANVTAWNAAIDQQYELFQEHYLWSQPADAFTVATVL